MEINIAEELRAIQEERKKDAYGNDITTYIGKLRSRRDDLMMDMQLIQSQIDDCDEEIQRYETFLKTHEGMIHKANKELSKLKKWFEDSKEAFETMDLKLYDVSSFCWRHTEEYPQFNLDVEFQWFCDDSYEQMVEYFKESDYDWDKRKQLGRTSSFWLHDNSIIDMDRRQADDKFIWDSTFYGLLNRFGYNDTMDFTTEGMIDIDDEYLVDCEANLKYIADGEFFVDVIREFDGVLKMYEYIKDFKDNQVKYFKEYLKCRQEQEEWEAEELKKMAEKERERFIIAVVSVVLA